MGVNEHEKTRHDNGAWWSVNMPLRRRGRDLSVLSAVLDRIIDNRALMELQREVTLRLLNNAQDQVNEVIDSGDFGKRRFSLEASVRLLQREYSRIDTEILTAEEIDRIAIEQRLRINFDD
jgi:hypothetical protein